jgi:hypothetical protein
MQFGFSYFYYLIHRGEKLLKPNVTEIWRRELDVDGDGVLSDNEMRTLVAMTQGKEFSDEVGGQVLLYKRYRLGPKCDFFG